MRSLLFLLLFTAFSIEIIAQQFHVSIKDDVKHNDFTVAGRLGNRFYTLDDKAGEFTSLHKIVVTKRDEYNDQVLKSSADPLKPDEPKRLELFPTGGKLYVIYQDVAKKRKPSLPFMAAEIDTATADIGAPKIIANFETAGYNARESNRDFIEGSPDSTKFLFFFGNEKAAIIYIVVTDVNLNVLWEEKEDLGSRGGRISVKYATVDNEGNVHVAYKLVETGKTKFSSGEINHIATFISGKKTNDVTFDLGEAQMHNLFLKYLPGQNALWFAGFYFTDDPMYLQGVFSGQLSLNDHKTTGIKKDVFPRELVEPLVEHGWASTKKKFGVFPYLKPTTIKLSNGSYGLIGQFRRSHYSDRGGYHMSGSVVLINFDAKGTLFSIVPKMRTSTAFTTGDSYSAFSFEDKVVVFYNDRIENLSIPITEPPRGSDVYKNVVLVAAIIDKDGTVKREKVVDLDKEDFMSLPAVIYREKENVFKAHFRKVKALGGFTSESKVARIEIR